MLTERTKNEAAGDLRVAAEAVERIDDGGDIAGLSDRLARLGDALRATGGAYEAAASRIAESDAAIERLRGGHHRRAAVARPAAPSPSHERFVAALASLHAAGDAARTAGRRSDEARRAVDALWRAARTGDAVSHVTRTRAESESSATRLREARRRPSASPASDIGSRYHSAAARAS